MDAVWKDNLETARQPAQYQSPKRAVQKSTVQARQVSFFSYMPALLVALLKDTLDLFLGWIPGIGAVITMCFSFLIFLLLMMSGSGKNYSLMKKGGFMAIATIVEMVPILSMILPIETITVFAIYVGDKNASKKEMSLRA